MQLFYNSFGLHALGFLEVAQERKYEGGEDAPQRTGVKIKVKVHLIQGGFNDNLAAFQALTAALATENAVLLWQDEATGTVFLNQTVTPESNNLPKDASHLDTFYMPVELAFCYYEQGLATNNQTVTFTPTGGAAIVLGNMTDLRNDYKADRFSPQRSNRRYAGGTVDLKGVFLTDATQPLGARRTALLALVATWDAAVNNVDGTLAFGGGYFSQLVRVESWSAEINQAVNAIKWRLNAIYTRFPNEGGYATAEYSTSERTDIETGDQIITLQATIDASDQATALSQLATIRNAAVLTLAGNPYTMAEQTKSEQTNDWVSANADGVAFLRLKATEEYRKRMGTVLYYTLKSNSSVDVKNGMTTTSFSGRVVASGSTATAAYNTALAQAQSLGANYGYTLLSSRINWDERQDSPSAPVEFVSLDFEYVYAGKYSQVFVEMSTKTSLNLFGVSSLQVSGYVTAADNATATIYYKSQCRDAYATSLVTQEETTPEVQQWQETGSTFTSLQIKVSFSFSVYQGKPSGLNAIEYEVSVTKDYLTLDIESTVTGTAEADNAADARTNIASLLTAIGLTNQVYYQDQDAERLGNYVYTNSASVPNTVNTTAFQKLAFTAKYRDKITGDTACIETEVTEELVYSGTRFVTQKTAGGLDVVQNTGTDSGKRTITARVMAATEAIADTNAGTHENLLTGDNSENHYELPQKRSTKFLWVPRVTGIPRTGTPSEATSNIKACEVTYVFEEILPNYPMP
jgi:hypothetical protein